MRFFMQMLGTVLVCGLMVLGFTLILLAVTGRLH